MILTGEAIANSLENIHDSWLIHDPVRDYHDLKYDLLDCLSYDYGWERISSDTDKISELKKWRDTTSNWKSIIDSDDVAMFPDCLKLLKREYMLMFDKDFCETVNRMSYCSLVDFKGMGELYRRNLESFKAEYGVFRFRCVIGFNLFKILRRHLRMTLDDFTNVYGNGLYDDPCFCDELLVELLVEGRLAGSVRAYKIEREYYEKG